MYVSIMYMTREYGEYKKDKFDEMIKEIDKRVKKRRIYMYIQQQVHNRRNERV